MKIENVHMEGFGIWKDRTWDSFGPGLNVLHGPNETGKSTFMAFIRSILFGFDRRGSARRYEPVNGGAHGGWLELSLGNRRVRVERKTGRHVRGAVEVAEAGVSGGEDALDRLLGGTTRTLYHNVFAFGLEELEHFHTLQDSEVATHISGAGLGIGAARWSSVQKDIEERQAALFLPRGQNSTINVAFRELDAVRDDLDRTENQPQDYWAAHDARTRMTSELAALDDIIGDLRKRIAHYEKRRKARPMIERRTKLEARLKEFPAIDDFPEGGIERLELLTCQIQSQRAELERKRGELEARKMERSALQAVADPVEMSMRSQIIESLKALMPRMDVSRRLYLSCLDRRDSLAREKSRLDASLASVRPPSQTAFMLFIVLMWAAAVGLFVADLSYVASGVFLISLSPLVWYRSRVRSTLAFQSSVADCGRRLEECQAELKRTESDARLIESEIRKLTGQSDVTGEDIDLRVAELDKMLKVSEEVRRIDEFAAQIEAEMRMIERQIEETRASVQQLMAEGAASSETEFVERFEIFRQRRQIFNEIERIPIEYAETGMLFDLRAEEDAACEVAVRELAEAEQRLIDVRHETGRLDERIANMERSEERARALVKKEKVLARLDVAAEQWAVLTLCRAMLDETRRIYETERQPEVLRQASTFFGTMTDGRYVRVFAPLEGNEIQVERADGVRLSPQLLSRGTVEQLYLSMRLALVREYANHVEPLPVIFDDIFVNFDPERARSSIRAVRELCSTHQVLLFTCHPHLVDIAQEIVPSAKVFPLQ